MSDVLSVVATLLLFGIAVVYATACDGMLRGKNHG
ncbi:hypothetical protein SAMN05421771_0530 [Granulicella pectinivorans]|jgi:hypothetical protein|uniref:Uncharacterized protein n=1 Tax=Granulicella pectinivorans TaxID=474950 RepID=A0A1I6LCI3_9BACT|nr:hypothetical protein SAMN05421771_0530 [Granulicella pectinivorans]